MPICHKKLPIGSVLITLVRIAGIEPVRVASQDSKSCVVSVNVLQVIKTRTSELSVGSSVFYIPGH